MKRWIGRVRCLLLGSVAVFSGCVTEVESLQPEETNEEDVGKMPQDGVPEAWEHRQNKCDTLSFYRENPAFNPNASPQCVLGKYKRLYYTTGEIRNGWVPVYSAGQEYLHTGWVRQECLVNGWPWEQVGSITCG